jgi:hypothetical protein
VIDDTRLEAAEDLLAAIDPPLLLRSRGFFFKRQVISSSLKIDGR